MRSERSTPGVTNIPGNSSSEHREKQQNNTQIFGEIQIGEMKYPSYLRPDGTPFTVGGEPIIVISCEGNSARVIMNLLDISNSIIEVVWENNEPKIIDLGGIEFLCKIYDNKVFKVALMSNKIKLPYHLYESPLVIIKQDGRDMLITENNELFYSVIYIEKHGRPHPDVYSRIFYKKGDKYIPVTFEGEAPLHDFIGVPDVEGMSLWDRNNRRLIYWDKEAETFRQVEKNGIVFENVHQNLKHDEYSINIGDKTVPFSKSLDNPNQPASIEINGNFFFVLYLDKNSSISHVSAGGQSFPIKINEPIVINGRTFYKIVDQRNYYIDGFYNPNGFNFLRFEINENKEIKTFDYQGKKLPIIDSTCSDLTKIHSENPIIEIYNFEGNNSEKIILMKNSKFNENEEEKGEDNEKSDKIDEEYIRLKLTPDQSEKNLITTSYKHGIICLSNSVSGQSKYEFYRINPDGTLDLAFKNAINISIKDNVIIECYDREVRFKLSYTLIRRPGTSSIFEPVDYNGKPCLVAKGINSGTVTYISIEDFSEIIEQYIGPDPEILTSMINNKFELGGETLFYNDDGTINLLDKKFHLANSKGKLVKSPENSILKVGDKEILLLVNKDDTIVGYFVGMKTDLDMLDLRHYVKTSPDLLESIKREVIKVSVDGVEAICNMNYPEFRALRICEIVNEYFYNRYVCNVGNATKISGKEFMCDGEQIEIQEIYSEEYVLDKKGELYYRKDLGNELTKVILPRRVYLSNAGIPYIHPDLYNSIGQNKGPQDGKFPLKIVNGQINPIGKFSNLYRVDMEDFDCIINGVEKTFINLWNYKTNQICSYTEESWGFEAFKICNHKTFFDDNNIRIYIDGDIIDGNIDVCKNIFGRNIILPRLKDNFREEYEYKTVIIHEQIKTEDFIFAKAWNSDMDGVQIYPLYKVDGNFVAIEIPEGYNFRFENGKILINGIPYGDNEVKLFYEKFRPEQINTKGVVEKVTGKVKDLTQK